MGVTIAAAAGYVLQPNGDYRAIQPGERGTQQLVEKYGQRLVCVRYRYDPGLASGVIGTPGFFVGGRLHAGSFDATSLIAALEASA